MKGERPMKIVCSKASLLKSINTVMKAVPSKSTLTILECILITADTDRIKLTANDMELGIETEVEGSVSETGKIALDARLFSNIVRKLPDSDVMISSDSDFSTRIVCEKVIFSIAGRDAEDFSYLPYVERDYCISISQFSLRELIRQTIFSIAANDSNIMMTGELFEINQNELRVISLDGHRVSIRKIELNSVYEDKKAIVPGKTLNEISKILEGGTEDMVDIYFTENHILFEFGCTVVISRLIEGNYFRVNQMLSRDYETKVTINKKEMIDCIDRATILIKEGDRRPLILNIADDIIEFRISSQEGTMNDTVTIDMEGKNIKIGFNPRFLIEALRVIDEETVDIYFMNSKAPCFIRDENDSYIYLILPINFIEA